MENERKFIVYKHTSPDGKSYIGMTSKTLEERSGKNGHGYRQNKEFITDIKKYGWDNFRHEVLKSSLDEEEAQQLEQYYIALWQTDNPEFGYNRSKGGEKPLMLGKQHTEEAKKKISESLSESLSGENAPWFGKHLQEEAKTKLSNSAKIRLSIPENNPFFGKHHKEETRQKISNSRKGLHWYNNGDDELFAFECPDGFTPGRLKRV